MDIATIVGVVLGFGLIIFSILLDGELGAFINGPGLAIVVGGSFAAAMISERMGNCINGIKVALNALFLRSPSVMDTIEKIVELSGIVRKDGILALENQEIPDAFLARGVRFAVDGVPPEEVQSLLRTEMLAMKQRHKRGRQLFKFMASTAPSMGMVGTLIGLVQMLQTLDEPSAIGPAMAVALLTTLYGAVLAFLVFGPIATKLEHRSSEESENMVIVVEGMDSILKGENGRVVREKLEGFLSPANRTPLET